MITTLAAEIQNTNVSTAKSNVDTLYMYFFQCLPRGYAPNVDLARWIHCVSSIQINLQNKETYTAKDWAIALKKAWGDKGLNGVSLSAALNALTDPQYTEDQISAAVIDQFPSDLVITLHIDTNGILANFPRTGSYAVDSYIKMSSNQKTTSSGQDTNELDNEGLASGQEIIWLAQPDLGTHVDLTKFCPGKVDLTTVLIYPPTKTSPVMWQTTVRKKLPSDYTSSYTFNLTIGGSHAAYYFDPFLGDTRV